MQLGPGLRRGTRPSFLPIALRRPPLKLSARAGILLATIIGLAIALATFGATGFGEILATAGRIGVGGFLLYCGWSLGVFVLLGAAWCAAAAGEPWRRVGLFSWARMVREAAADLLPFSQLGGIVVGTRTLTTAGIPTARAYAAFVVDLTTEMAGQLIFTLFGLAILIAWRAGQAAQLLPLILGGTGVMVAVILAFFFAQRAAIRLTERIAGKFLPSAADAIGNIHEELTRIYAKRDRVLLAFAFNLAAWVASAFGAWIALRLMGVRMSPWEALALESLIFTLRSIAFVIPGGIGVQEAAYALAGPLFGLPPEAMLALALAKRARDLAIGLPTLLVWQLTEAREATRRPSA